MKAKKCWILNVALLTSVLTMCLVGRTIPKPPQLEKDDKAETVYQHSKWYLDTIERHYSDDQFNIKDIRETDVEHLLRLYSDFKVKKSDTLKGLHGVGVWVKRIQPEAEKHGLSTESFRTAVELRLRQHGINVIDDWPNLYIDVKVLLVKKLPLASIHVSAEFHETAVLVRNPKIAMGVTT